MTAEEELGALALLLRQEKEEEESRMRAIREGRPLKERRDEGLCWYPVQVMRVGFAFGGNVQLTVERNEGDHPVDQFYKGSPVFVYRPNNPKEYFKGVIAGISKKNMEVQLFEQEIPDSVREDAWVVELRFDDRTFFEMERALNVAINLEMGEMKDLRDRILGYKMKLPPMGENDAEHINIDARLNQSQRSAVKSMLENQDILAIHGPPGTGKTSTLAEGIRLLASKGKKLLVSAPSNTAVDHLVFKLAELDIDVVRIGHLGKVGEQAFPHALEAKLQASSEAKMIKQLRQRAEKERAEATKYKRNFGQEEREARKQAYREARDLEKEARNLERQAEEHIIDRAQVVAATLIGTADMRIRAIHYDAVIIDEAAQALEPAAWVPILKGNSLILAGDPFQLPPTVKSMKAAKGGLEISLLEKVIDRHENTCLLDEQYRMNELIMGFSNHRFYHGKLKAHQQAAFRALAEDEVPLEFIDTAGCGFDELQGGDGVSKSNPDEAEIVVKRYNELIHRYGNHIGSIGLITPYKAQSILLKELLGIHEHLSIHTVDGFQGQERDVIIISLVRSNEQGEIGFLTDYRRMNVAMTRARKKLIVLGDSATIGCDDFYASFLEYCEQYGVYRSAWEYLS